MDDSASSVYDAIGNGDEKRACASVRSVKGALFGGTRHRSELTTLLQQACEKGMVELTRLLLEQGETDVNDSVSPHDKWHPLTYVLMASYLRIPKTSIDFISLLCGTKHPVDLNDDKTPGLSSGCTFLDIAITQSAPAPVQMHLMRLGATQLSWVVVLMSRNSLSPKSIRRMHMAKTCVTMQVMMQVDHRRRRILPKDLWMRVRAMLFTM